MADPRKALDELLEEVSHAPLDAQDARILIVDDDPSVTALLQDLLGGEGFKPSIASSGQEALTLLKEASYDVVLVDKNLPDVSGIEVIREGRELHPETRFIVVTGYASIESVIAALDVGAFSYITKPIRDGQVVLDRIWTALQRKRIEDHNDMLLDRLRSAYEALFNATTELDMMKDILQQKLKARDLELKTIIRDVIQPLGSVERDVEALFKYISGSDSSQTGRAKMVLDVVRRVRKHSEMFLTELDPASK